MIQRDLKRTSFKHLKLVNVFLMVQKDLNGMSFKRLKLVCLFNDPERPTKDDF